MLYQSRYFKHWRALDVIWRLIILTYRINCICNYGLNNTNALSSSQFFSDYDYFSFIPSYFVIVKIVGDTFKWFRRVPTKLCRRVMNLRRLNNLLQNNRILGFRLWYLYFFGTTIPIFTTITQTKNNENVFMIHGSIQ